MVIAFDPARGFGFIRSADFAADVFVHASAVVGGGALKVGQRVRFEAAEADRGPRATRVEPGRRGLSPGLAGLVALGLAVVGPAAALAFEGVRWPVAWLLAINPATAAVYAWDKHRALRDARRVPEVVLLALALLGGSPGALAAMLALHHKTRKPRFLVPFWAIVGLQVASIAVLIARR